MTLWKRVLWKRVLWKRAGEEGAAEDAVNLEVPAEPPRSTLSFEWGENWTSSSQLGRFFSQYAKPNMENDTNLGYPNNKAEESVGLSAPSKEIKSKKGKGKKKKNNNNNNNKKDRNKKNEKEKMDELAEPVPE
jgi:hypothetical protein